LGVGRAEEKVKAKDQAKQAPESNSASADDALKPAFWLPEQTAAYLGLTEHQLYLYRRKGGGSPFVQHGVRTRYAPDDVRQWAAELPRFASRAEAYAHNPQRADGAAKQRAAVTRSRKTRWAEPKPERKKAEPKGASVTAAERAP
jgi:hypothetical protein